MDSRTEGVLNLEPSFSSNPASITLSFNTKSFSSCCTCLSLLYPYAASEKCLTSMATYMDNGLEERYFICPNILVSGRLKLVIFAFPREWIVYTIYITTKLIHHSGGIQKSELQKIMSYFHVKDQMALCFIPTMHRGIREKQYLTLNHGMQCKTNNPSLAKIMTIWRYNRRRLIFIWIMLGIVSVPELLFHVQSQIRGLKLQEGE